MSFETSGFGGSGARFSGLRGRTADGTSRTGVRYPSPFFDIGQTYLPPSIKALLRWCRYYYLVHPLINTVIHKMAEYPITEIIIDEKSTTIREKWEEMLGKHLRYRAFQIEVGLDYYTYGISIITIHFPFTKFLICRNCSNKTKASKTFYKWRHNDYIIECTACHYNGPAKVQDYYLRDQRRIRLQRWNPEYINIDPGFAGSDPTYTFELPIQVKNDITMGKKHVLDTIPDVFIEAMRRSKFISFSPENVFVMKRPIISQKEDGWGMPLLLPVLKDTFYLQVLRKAQEAIALQHVVPLNLLFPQAGSSSADPYSTTNLSSWKFRMEGEIAKFRMDPGYIPILPLPIGHETIGGEGKALMLSDEMQAWSDHIIVGMGVPRDFVYGGASFSGSNVSMRMVENSFLGYRIDHENMLTQFVIRRISDFMGWPSVAAHMRRFKMADDLQRASLFFQLNQAQKLSDMTLLQEVDQDPHAEEERRDLELNKQLALQRKMQLAQAQTQAEVLSVQTKSQIDAARMQQEVQPQQGPAQQGQQGQQTAQPPQQQQSGYITGQEGEMVPGQRLEPAMPEGSTVSAENAQSVPQDGVPLEASSPLHVGQKGGGYNLVYLAKRAASHLNKLDGASRTIELNRMRLQNPQLYQLVQQMMRSKIGSQANPLDAAQSPMPQQKPSRRKDPVG